MAGPMHAQGSGFARIARLAGLFPAALAMAPGGALAQAGDPADSPDRISAGTVPVPPPPAGAALQATAPVIGDDEFNRSIPPLSPGDDPELDRPLESIEEF